MRGFAVAAIFAGAAMAAPAETVYATQEVTITSCGPEVTNCPARSHSATASVPVEASSTPAASVPATSTPAGSVVAASSAPVAESSPAASSPAASSPAVSTAQIYSTSTIYSTQITTSADKEVTITVPISTTICPVTATETPGASSAPAVGTPVAASSSPSVAVGVPVYTPVAGTPAASTPAVATPPAGTPGYPMPASSGAQGLSSAPAESSVCVPSTTTSYVYVTPGASIPVGTGSMPYPSGGVYTAGTPPAGTPAVGTPMSPAGTPGATPNAFTGGSGRVNAMGALAGLGAIAAFFL